MPSPNASPPVDKTTLDTSKESATQALYRAVIGALNADYYLPIFSAYESTAKVALKWNTAASLYTLNWMVFRKLWRAAWLYTGAMAIAALVFFSLIHLVFQLSTGAEWAMGGCLLLGSFVVPGFFGNRWLHADSRKRMAQALQQSATLQQACQQLSAQSSSRNRFLGVAAINIVLMGIGVGWYLRATGGVEMKVPPPQPAIEAPASPPLLSPVPQPMPLSVEVTPPQPAEVAVLPPAEPSTPPLLSPAPVPAPVRVTAPELPAAPAQTESTQPIPPLKSKPAVEVSRSSAPYYVNVGLFANTDNAEKAHQRLKEAGLAVTTDELKMKKGTRSRVRVGPFISRSQADEAARSVKALELDAVVGRE